MFANYECNKIDVFRNWFGRNGFEAKMKNERFTVGSSRYSVFEKGLKILSVVLRGVLSLTCLASLGYFVRNGYSSNIGYLPVFRV